MLNAYVPRDTWLGKLRGGSFLAGQLQKLYCLLLL